MCYIQFKIPDINKQKYREDEYDCNYIDLSSFIKIGCYIFYESVGVRKEC